ncbi:MAG TPA: SGNH/GDSL hydrolase family protein [Ramlibacter sp.]|nr:SGNH/GDSL hydrolase family protein [Ramlibacter sp.]
MNWKISRRGFALAASAITAALVVACGGGGDAAPPKTAISRVIIAGDSLADAGTFGAKFTVQKASDPAAGYPVYAQIIATNYGLPMPCNFFASSTGGASFTTNAACRDFAVGGGHIVNPPSQGGAVAPFALAVQLGAALQVMGGTYQNTDLIIVDAGGNDAADLVAAYLGAASGAAGVQAYQTFLLQQLDAATIGATLPTANGAAILAGMYMQKLADTYWATVKATTLDKGATHVAILNVPDITLTPRFKAVLAQVSAQFGQASAQQLQGAIQQWIQAFNAKLKADINGDTRVALVPFYEDFTDELASPAQYGLTNATTPACGETGFPATCVDAQLDATPPAGATAGWWKTYAFSNGFHPTPYGHSLLAGSVSRALARAGWL